MTSGLIILFFLMILVSTTGALADHFYTQGKLQRFRIELSSYWSSFLSKNSVDLTQKTNQLFIKLYDDLYGERTFSRHRFIASLTASISTYVVVGIFLYLGFSEEAKNIHFTFSHITAAAVSVALLNLIPDFISLAETRLILVWAKHRGLMGILFFIIVDVLATTLIFLLSFLLVVILFTENIVPYTLEKPLYDLFEKVLDDTFAIAIFLVALITTFVTSLMWILFVLTYLITRFFYLFLPLAKHVYEQISVSEKPISAIASFVNVLIFAIWLMWQLIAMI